MFVQLNAIVVDPDAGNRAEISGFLTQHGVHVIAQLQGVEQLASLLQRPDAAQLVVVNLDPAPHEALKKLGAYPRQFQNASFFVLSQLIDANLAGADLTDADLTGASLTGAQLSFANLRSANLAGADLTTADLRYADLSYARLADASLTGAILFEVIWSDTTCPDGSISDTHADTCVGYGI